MEMHAIQSKQASMSSGCIVGKPYLGITSHLPVIRPQSARTIEYSLNSAQAGLSSEYRHS